MSIETTLPQRDTSTSPLAAFVTDLQIVKETAGLRFAEDYDKFSKSLLGQLLSKIAPETGVDYLNGRLKEGFELAIALPLSIVLLLGPAEVIAGSVIIADLISGDYINKIKKSPNKLETLKDTLAQLNPIYVSTRKGKNGKDTQILKFRSMYPGSDKIGTTDANSKQGQITPLGHILRGLNIDELLQVFNVVQGTMYLMSPFRMQEANSLESIKNSGAENAEIWHKEYASVLSGILTIAALYLGHTRKEQSGLTINMDLEELKLSSLMLDVFKLYKVAEIIYKMADKKLTDASIKLHEKFLGGEKENLADT